MNNDKLQKHIQNFLSKKVQSPEVYKKDYQERIELVNFYKEFTRERILEMNQEEIYKYISPLWAMLIWGNKHYVVNKILEDNGEEHFKRQLAHLVWSEKSIGERWNQFRESIKGMGPAMISEILCKTHPEKYMIWNRRAQVGLHYLEIGDLPKYDYQMTGTRYEHLCEVSKNIANELTAAGFEDSSLLAVDYFIWRELQVEENLSKLKLHAQEDNSPPEPETSQEAEFIHDEVRDKLRNIGQWLGFQASIEQKVAEGSKVDTIWESTIGNLGRVIYVFEVQTKGSIDSLLLNLLKSLKNPAVQGVVAVSDKLQLEKIERHAMDLPNLNDKLKYWNYEEILNVHENLEYVNGCINQLELVPEGF